MQSLSAKTSIALFLLLAFPGVGWSQLLEAQATTTYSVSGQFSVHHPNTSVPSRFATALREPVSMDPALLAISCERIKQGLSRQLGGLGPWAGTIHLYPRPARAPNEAAGIIASKPLGKWSYQVDLPDSLDPNSFTLTIVHVLLLEMANRRAGDRSAEIPFWLTDGLAEELVASDANELILPALRQREGGLAIKRVMAQGTRSNSLVWAQSVLLERAPLSFEQLSWPAGEVPSADAMRTFRASAQLLVNRLLQLPRGPACMRGMLEDLPRRYNWQFAFLNGFQIHFQRLLDVEKWWALQVTDFTGRSLMLGWTPAESWKRLEDAIRVPVEIRAAVGDMPVRREVSLQDVIREWESSQQRTTLEKKVRELQVLRIQLAPGLVPLVDNYLQTLSAYLKRPAAAWRLLSLLRPGRPADRTLAQTIAQLDALDQQRAALRETEPAAPTNTVTARVP